MNLRVIPTGVHGTLDYPAGAVNLAFPRLDGTMGLVHGLITDYEMRCPCPHT